MNKKILHITPDPSSASSFYRGYGELTKIRKILDNSFDIEIAKGVDWPDLCQADAVFMERPYSIQYLEFLKYAQQEGVPVWVDYDDYLLGVPSWNPTHKLYAKKESRESIEEIISIADFCSFSTDALRTLMVKDKKPNRVVIQNGIAKDRSWIERRLAKDPIQQTKSVLWRGSETHQKDLLSFAAQVVETANKYPDWKFDFMGYNPWFISEYLPYSQFLGAHTMRNYFSKFASCASSLIIVPLFDDPFNRAKSNIAALEASWLMGSNVICPDWPEWQIDGWINYKDPEDFREKLDKCLSEGYNQDLGDRAYKAIEDKYTSKNFVGAHPKISPQNYKRINILELMGIIK